MTDPKRLAEAARSYDLEGQDLASPLILTRDGEPVAVLLSFEEYRRLRDLEAEEERRRQVGWEDLNKLLIDVNSRPTKLSPEQIEAEITAAQKGE